MKKSLYLLALLSFFSYFRVPVGGLNAKYDQLFIILTFCVLIFYKVIVWHRIYIDKAGFFLIILCLISFVSSFFNAPDPTYSLTQTVNLYSVSLAYFIFPNVLTSYDDLSDFISVLLKIAKIWLIGSVLLFLFSYTTNTMVFGVNSSQNEHEAFGVYATMVEPNIFGSYMLMIFFLSFSLYVSETGVKGMTASELRNVVILAVLGIFISFTRGVWLATVVGVVVYYIFNSKNIAKTLRQAAFFSIGVLLLLYVTSEVLEIEFVRYKLMNFFSSERGTGQTRMALWSNALNNWIEKDHVFFGNGTFSYATFFNLNGYDAEHNEWISNVYIMFLHDAGLIGLLMYLLFYSQLIALTLRSGLYRNLVVYPKISDTNIGLFVALLGVGIAFFFTTALTTSYPWILFGIVSAYNRINKKNLRAGSEDQANPGSHFDLAGSKPIDTDSDC